MRSGAEYRAQALLPRLKNCGPGRFLYFKTKSPTVIGRTFHRHVTADFDTGVGAGNVDKASAEKAARFHSCRLA